MGEIGWDRSEFLHELRLWEIKAIIKGYRARTREMWMASRLNAFFIMSSMCDLKKSGIRRDTDLIEFPWEKARPEPGSQPSEEEVERLRQMMRSMNAKLAEEKKEE